MPSNSRVTRPIILGIVGDSATGKTTVAAGVAKILGEDRVVTICSDDYHMYDRIQRAENGTSALDPECNYLNILEDHLKLLRSGRPILKPVYSHHTGTLERPVLIEPKPYIVVEGLLGYRTRAMRDSYDVKIYLDPEEELRIKWKVHRDTTKRGYTEEQVMASLEKRKEDSPAYIHPQRTYADIVVNFNRPKDKQEEMGSALNVRHVLRPTLPHPDLSPILNLDTNGVVLKLSRDRDGKPVDTLEIDGSIEEKKAKKMEDLLWSLLPEASHLRENVGGYDDDSQISHPLALTQLLIAYHMVKASMGVHAV